MELLISTSAAQDIRTRVQGLRAGLSKLGFRLGAPKFARAEGGGGYLDISKGKRKDGTEIHLYVKNFKTISIYVFQPGANKGKLVGATAGSVETVLKKVSTLLPKGSETAAKPDRIAAAIQKQEQIIAAAKARILELKAKQKSKK